MSLNMILLEIEIKTYQPFQTPPQTAAMAFRTASLSLRRMISTSAVRSDMTVTFGGPNAVYYNKATNVKQVCIHIVC